ncbi:hypothetical protein DFQ14_11252 [Halopolyspora algeriensis]|uniref:DUF6779 domain-containing protein n=1 Tax=Halopolyspora algeriensis TaxID=1500506 RepID=A0A368VKJ0_9ACTN|nr:DUF6779 domain-containing protein [Halopolyspora algeriensis]RCW40173.1 hypothetical protein DFQ14_11252 [Halopolyspora algeriensis]TQM46345.1 hypothetical protein FHU43_4018 [Halopolyspora algeriensis]
MPDPNGSEPAPQGGRATVLWGGVLVPAVAATAVLVLGDSARLLRLGLVAALWATLIAALAVVRLRNRAAEHDERLSERQRLYELELEREVAARREFELEVENETRRRVAEEADGEMESLRAELRHLRETLESLVGGDVLYERVALHTESTRVRSLPDPGAAGNARGQGYPAEIRTHDTSGRAVVGSSSAGTDRHISPVATEASGRTGEVPRPEAVQPATRQAPHPSPGGARAPHPPPPPPAPSPPSRPRTGDAEGVSPSPQAQGDLPGASSAAGPVHNHPAGQEPPEAEGTSQAADGAHAEGTSVVDLLAAYGSARDGGRRRRRSG